MRKRIFGRRLKRDTNERKALFRSLMHGLVLHGKITTSHAKAAAIRASIEKLVTMAKNKGEDSRRLLIERLANEKVADKIISEIAPLFASRPGGYTRTLKLGHRLKDDAHMVLMTWVEKVSVTAISTPKRNSPTDKSSKEPKKETLKKQPKKEAVQKPSSKKKGGTK